VNAVLKANTGEENGAERISAWLDSLPRGKAILLVVNLIDGRAGTTADLFPYLAWPRPVVITYEVKTAAARLAKEHDRYCAVGFFSFKPPPGMPVDQCFGPASFVKLIKH
jgi:hypothetical protein